MEQTGIFESNSKIVFDELIEKYEEKYEEITNYLKGSKADKSEVEKKADKSEVAALKSKVHTLESQVEKLLKSNEELSKSNELQVSQLQSTLIAPQRGTDLTMSQMGIAKPELKTLPEEYVGYKPTTSGRGDICGFEYENSAYVTSLVTKSNQTQKEVDSNLDKAQHKTLSLLKELYYTSLSYDASKPTISRCIVPDNENNLFQLYRGIHANLTTSNHIEWWKKWTCPLESQKKFTDAIISQVIIDTFFDMLPYLDYNDTESLKREGTESLKREIATINSSGFLCQKSQEKLNSVLGEIKRDTDMYRNGYDTYIELTNGNFSLLQNYKENFNKINYTSPNNWSSLHNSTVFAYNKAITINPADNDKIKEIISGGKSVSQSNYTNGKNTSRGYY